MADPRRTPGPPRLPSVPAASRNVHAVWLNPTEDAYAELRRDLIRRRWKARKALHWQPTPTRRNPNPPRHTPGPAVHATIRALRELYDLTLKRQQARDWEASPAEIRSRQRNRNNPHQYQRELMQRQPGTTALLTLNIPAQPHDHAYTPAGSRRTIYHQAQPHQNAAPIPLPSKPPRLSRLHRFGVHHLARQLYHVHAHGWPSLALNSSSTGTPRDTPTPSTRGGFQYAATLTFDNVVMPVDTIITSHDYHRALISLPPDQQDEMRDYYRRRTANGDTCPSIEDSHYTRTFKAFAALLEQLFNQGSLRANASANENACVSRKKPLQFNQSQEVY